MSEAGLARTAVTTGRLCCGLRGIKGLAAGYAISASPRLRENLIAVAFDLAIELDISGS